MTIELLNLKDVLTGSTVFAVNVNGQDYRMLPESLITYIQDNLDFQSAMQTQYYAPAATGFSVTIAPITAGDNVHLILTPAAGYAAGTIVLPAVAGVVDKQEVLVNCTQSVATLTIDGNGAVAVTGAPASLSSNGFFRLKYDAVLQTWYRIG